MLGHAKLDTTQVYTQVSAKKLKEVHAMAHPARLKRTKRVVWDEAQEEPTVEELLAALEREGEAG